MASRRTGALAEFLSGAFHHVDDMRTFVRLDPRDGERLVRALPDEDQSLDGLAMHIVEALEVRRLVDAAFFDRLTSERPERADEIAALRQGWLEDAGAALPALGRAEHTGFYIGLSPHLERGAVEAWWRRVDGPLFLGGRASGWVDLAPRHGEPPEKAARRAAQRSAVERIVGTRDVAFLQLSAEAALSRAHFVVERTDAGITVHALPGVAVPVRSGAIGDFTLDTLPEGAARTTPGPAEVRVLLPGTSALLVRLWVFPGAGAEPDVLERGRRVLERELGESNSTVAPTPPRP